MPNARKRILVAEDNWRLSAVLCSTFSDTYEVVAVGDGKSMEEELARSSFDLVITDLNLPERAGTVVLHRGEYSARTGRAFQVSPLRAIVITGMDPEDEEVQRARRMPSVLELFHKPLDLEALRRYVDRVLKETSGANAAAYRSAMVQAVSRSSVLLVDDEHEIHREISTLLDRAGYQVRSCCNPDFVLDLCRTHRFDLLLISFIFECDTAAELIEKLHRSLSAQALPPMVILNGLGEALTLDYFRNYPQVKAIVHKPIQGSDLLCAVRGLLGGQARTGAVSSRVVS